MGFHLTLPDTLRPRFREIFGCLYKGKGDDTIKKLSKDLGSPTKLISVGDVTTFHLLNLGIIPDILIVDDRTKRGPASDRVVVGTKHKGFTEISVDNPAGVITEDLIDAVGNALNADEHVRIFVRGEEDLAAVPAILMAPEGSAVLYGQPDEGVVLVKITLPKKEQMKDLLTEILNEQEHNTEQIETIRRKLDGYQNH
ncbi:GTP-dependent dephospho-CoA kinase family protein [Methanolobus mangrovi]|uniref:GTP-dependent dephospho-CoA kinase n=1 Tax=Methanolobus mangrovi TaxID=3072977 RepID=A0AA51YFL2_9EURY|nr:GTP-dependent dephospho-CoA kinase family protein [Methanolobus mangrovi]WMW21076.1 GTP-dependent dephospho-CoA kinase family protein [Methanolobus mangrovi]